LHLTDLLRRLSRGQDTEFCGRILVFLARFFPVSERSGLNIISEFNLDNSTVFAEIDEAASVEMDLAGDGEANGGKLLIEEDEKK
jgi:THO complex subunit 1